VLVGIGLEQGSGADNYNVHGTF